ncbi:intraflagellar transport-associated protein isoform 2-T2 [Leptodactylus fuscus]|uniref:intraflagellar transport-associated protein isoform X2 n=1 Tax=Leptodactylus fuscus TaxID=238119 RepID=UPI003F4F067E
MPSSDGTPPVAEDEEMAKNVLSRFISIPEQTYEEFLSTFTCLPQGADRQHPEVMLDGSQLSKRPTAQGAQDTTDVADQQDGPEEVDNYFNSSDIDTDSDNEETSPSVLLFPGEADLEPARGSEPIVRNTCLQNHTSPGVESAAEEHLSDEVQPFSLDQTFDYDRVALTSKLSEEEENFLRRQKVEETIREA